MSNESKGQSMLSESVLVVDQDVTTTDFVRSVVRKEGYSVFCTQSGEDAIALLEKKAIDILITALPLPQVSGIELLQRARFLKPGIGMVVMVEHDSIAELIRCLQAGAQAVLVKPLATAELLRVIEEVIEKSRLVKENMRLKTLLPLFEMNKAMVRELDETKVFRHIIRVACLEARADNVAIVLLDSRSKELVVRVTSDSRCLGENGNLHPSVENVCWSAIKTGKPALISHEKTADAGADLEIPTFSLGIPMAWQGRPIGVIYCGKSLHGFAFSEGDVELLSILAGQAVIAIENARLFEALKVHEVSLQESLKKSLTAQEDERRRISGELHDGLAQLLISASYSVQTSSAYVEASRYGEAREELSRAADTLNRSVQELRRTILDLRPMALAELGLVGALQQIMEIFEAENDIRADFRVIGASLPLPWVQEVTIYRVLQEAIHNVRKHAQASKVEVTLKFDEDSTIAKVTDDGQGFDLDKTTGRIAGRNMGINTMRDRLEAVGGVVEIDTAPGKGTRILFKLPNHTAGSPGSVEPAIVQA